jgi:protein SCO1/2
VSPDEKLVLPGWIKLGAVAFVIVIAAAISFAVFEPIQVLPRLKISPGFSLTASDGTYITSETTRGSVVLYNFAPTDCGSQCDEMNETMRAVGERVATEVDLGEIEMMRLTIALDENPDVETLAQAAERSGAGPGSAVGDGEDWRWIGGSPELVKTVVGWGFEIYYEEAKDGSEIDFDPAFVLVDGSGVIRGMYEYDTIANNEDKLVQHIQILAEEIRYANGPAAVAYEAAHLFLCYP